MIKIDKKIIGYAVAKPGAGEKAGKPEFKREGGGDRAEVIRMHEKLERPEMLVGSTLKLGRVLYDGRAAHWIVAITALTAFVLGNDIGAV